MLACWTPPSCCTSGCRCCEPDSLLVCVSQSGESAELVRLIERLPAGGRPTIAAVTNGSANTLAAAADIALDTCAGEELGPSTMTFAGAMAVLEALAGDPPLERAAPRDGAPAGRTRRAPPTTSARGSAAGPRSPCVGRGSARAAAEMGALTLKEAARFPAESMQAAQFRHGPLELAGPHLAVMVFATEPAHPRRWSWSWPASWPPPAPPCSSSARTVTARTGAEAIAVGPLSGGLAAAAATVPAQLLAWRLARCRGLTPGEFAIAGKVTTRE